MGVVSRGELETPGEVPGWRMMLVRIYGRVDRGRNMEKRDMEGCVIRRKGVSSMGSELVRMDLKSW